MIIISLKNVSSTEKNNKFIGFRVLRVIDQTRVPLNKNNGLLHLEF